MAPRCITCSGISSINSIRFSKDDEPPLIKVRGQETKDHFKITIEDNGIGFDEGYLDRIFRPFQQLHEKKGQYGGTGIGLAICRKIVELHGGTITARSTLGGRVHFYREPADKKFNRRIAIVDGEWQPHYSHGR